MESWRIRSLLHIDPMINKNEIIPVVLLKYSKTSLINDDLSELFEVEEVMGEEA